MLKRICMSYEAHKQNWQARHFEKTKMGRQLLKYKNLHQGEKCFIIGNGPSLRAEDLQKLYENGIISFGTNRIYNIFDQTEWRPTYYVSEDIVILKDIQRVIETIPANAKFIPINLKWYEGVNIEGAQYFYLDYSGEYPQTHGLSLDIPHGIRCRGTVTMTCIQMAIYMGFSEIYLLGVDHNYSRIIDENGNVIENLDVKDYFSANYDTDFKSHITRNLHGTTHAFCCAERLSKDMMNFKIYNATRGGKLEAFQRVDFNALFGGIV